MNAVEQALEQANRCENEVWRLWHYRATTGALLLCGYHLSFDVTGYLSFQSPSYVRLPQYLRQAHFTLGQEGDAGMPPSHLLPAAACAILVRTSEATFCIVCQDVVFTRQMP